MRYSTFYIQVDDISLKEAIHQARTFLSDGRQHTVVTPNPEMVMLAKTDPSFREVFSNSSLSLIDGIGLLWGLQLFGIPVRHRVAGVDFTEQFLKTLNENEQVFILGGEGGVSGECAKNLTSKGVNVVGTFEPARDTYKSTAEGIQILDNEQHQLIIQKIRDSHARILLVALGHGKQEKWLHYFIKLCPEVSLGIGVGGTIDYLSGNVKRAPIVMQNIGLEWLWRFFLQPWRIQRILTATVKYAYEVLRWMVSRRFKYRPLAIACVLNSSGQVLVVKRGGQKQPHWQLPQGGIENDETIEMAAKRELLEEVSIESVEYLGLAKQSYRYIWKKTPAIPGVVQRHYGYKGQQASITFWRFTGDDSTIKVDGRELVQWKWIPMFKLRQVIHTVRLPLVLILEDELPRYVKK